MFKNSKKAQEGFSLPALLAIILGGAALILLILGFSLGWGYVFGKIGLLPDTVEAKAQICAQTSSTLQYYCAQFDEVRMNSLSQRVTCKYLEASIPALAESPKDCSAYSATEAKRANETCTNEKLKTDYKINNIPCSEWNTRWASQKGCFAPDNRIINGITKEEECKADWDATTSTCSVSIPNGGKEIYTFLIKTPDACKVTWKG